MNIPNARERILEAAVKIFADKSFEGARIEEIAKEAKVPKSLIYYHFKSKDEILYVLTNNFINEYMNLISLDTNETHQEKAEKLPERMKNKYYEFGQKNADLIRVMFIDSLKKSKEEPVFYKIVDEMIKKEQENAPHDNYNVHERAIAEFFTSFIPNYAYVCFAESWTRYFDIERKEFDSLFLKVYSETHGEYHKKHD